MNVLLVVGGASGLTASDTACKTKLEAMGHTVTPISDQTAVPANIATYHLVVIVPSITTSDLGTKYRDVAVPVIADGETWRDGSSAGVAGHMGLATSQTTTTASGGFVADAKHPLSAGKTGSMALYSSNQVIYYATGFGATVPQVVWHTDLVNNRPSIFGYEAGALLADGRTAPARRVGWGYGYFNFLTAAGDAAFQSAVMWATDTLPRSSLDAELPVVHTASATPGPVVVPWEPCDLAPASTWEECETPPTTTWAVRT